MAEANEEKNEDVQAQEAGGQSHEADEVRGSGEKPEGKQSEKSGELSVEALRAELEKARKDAAKYRVERNELADDAKAYRELKESEKSDLERLHDEMERTKAELNAARQKAIVSETMVEFGISQEDAVLLGSGTEDELRERAARIASLRKQAEAVSPPSDRPREGLRRGNGEGGEEVDSSYPSDWI